MATPNNNTSIIAQIAVLETKFEGMENTLFEIKNDLKLHTQQEEAFQEKMVEMFSTWRKESDERYASKLAEKLVYGMVGIILTSVIVGIISLVLK